MEKQQLNNDANLCIRWAFGLTLLFIFIFPGIMFITGYNYSLQFFQGWTYLSFTWLVIAGLYITTRPLIDYYIGRKEA